MKISLKTAAAAVAAVFYFATFLASATVLDTSPFAKKIAITASGYTGSTTLNNFPALVRLSNASGFDFADFTNPADELRFTDSTGNNLDFEIDTWDSASNTALIWVSIPSLSGTTTKITAWFSPSSTIGLPAVYSTNVWTSAGYVGVWHMRELSGTVADATGHHLDAVPAGATTYSVAVGGMVGAGRQNATAESGCVYLVATNYDSFAVGNTFVASGWFRATGTPSGDNRLISRKSVYTEQGGWEVLVKNNGKEPNLRGYDNSKSAKATIPTIVNTGWQHYAFVFNNKSASIYKNGSSVQMTATEINAATDNGQSLGIGSYRAGDPNSFFLGDMDEVRLHNGLETADWAKANYDTQNNNASFLSYGAVSDIGAIVHWFDYDGTTALDPAMTDVEAGNRPVHAEPFRKPTLHDRYAFQGWTLVGGDGTVYPSNELPVVSMHEDVSYKAVYRVIEHSDAPNISFLGFAHTNILSVVHYAGTTPLTDFPVLVRVSGMTVDGFAYNDLNSSGDGVDIAFFDMNGNSLPAEIDTWNSSGESLVWVRLPSMQNGTLFTMCWGSSLVTLKDVCDDNVWDGYVGVWHLKETDDGGVTIHDSTTNKLDGIAASDNKGSLAVTDGAVGGARRIAQDNYHAAGIIVDVLSSASKKTAAESLGINFSASFWMRADGVVRYSNLIGRRKGDNGTSWGFRFYDNGKNVSTPMLMNLFSGSTTAVETSGDFNIGAVLSAAEGVWKKVDVIWRMDGVDQVADLYANGIFFEKVILPEEVAQEDANIGIGCSTQDAYLNADSGSGNEKKGRRFDGEMDEVRLSPGVPSSDRIKADYDTVAVADFIASAQTITWADKVSDSDVVFDTTLVGVGGHPSHGAVTKAADSEHSYEFIGWNTNHTATAGLDLTQEVISGPTTYYAIWKLHAPGGWATVNWFEEDGRNPLDPATTGEDAGVAATRADPTKTSTVQLDYVFVGWTPVEGGPTNTAETLATFFEGGKTYNLKAVFEKRIRTYTLTFLNDDDSVIDAVECRYGQSGGSVAAPIATKAPTLEKVYIFSGWEPKLTYVFSNATYRATYTEADNLAPGAPDGFSRGLEFVVSGYTGDSALTNFPVLVRLSENGRNGGFSYSDLLIGNGDGIRFRLLDGTPLKHQIDTWNPEGESLVWVALPEMTNVTKFAMYYRTVRHHADHAPVPEGDLWSDVDYVGVWHLGEPGEGEVAICDATTNHLDGTSAADIQASDDPTKILYGGSETAGIVGNARRIAYDNFHAKGIVIDATNGTQKIVVDSLTNGSFSASFWISPEGFSDAERQWSNFLTRRRGDYGTSWGVGMHSNADGLRVYYGPRAAGDADSFACTSGNYLPVGTGAPVLTNKFADIFVDGKWSKIDVVWKNEALDGYSAEDWPASWFVYLDGDLASCGPLPTAVQYEDANIGIGCSTQDEYANAYGGGSGSYGGSGQPNTRKGRRFNGEMDEVRLRKCVPTADWIKADHDTVASATFLSSSIAMELDEYPELVDVGVDEIGDNYCVVTGKVLFVGRPATTSAVRVMLGTSADNLSAAVTTNLGYGVFALVANSLSAETMYFYALEEEDGSGRVFTTATNSFTTLASPSGNVNLTISPGDNVIVASVAVRGETVVGENGVYSVPAGLPVTVTFVAADGYALVGAKTQRVTIDSDTTLPSDLLPTAGTLASMIRVNEIVASNGSSGLMTENGGPEMDWVELYNASDDDIDVTGWYLSDNEGKPTKDKAMIQGNGLVPARGYKIIWMDSSYADYTADEAYTKVGLSASGSDPVVFSTAGGALVSIVRMPAQVKDYSYGIPAGGDGSEYVYFRTPTPGAANGAEGFGPPTPEVTYSVPHGFKTEAFDLELVCADNPGAQIRYTLDGTSPTAESALYTTPIRVEHTTIVRAAVPTADAVLQYDSSATYIFLDEVLEQAPSTTAPAAAAALGFPNSGAVNKHVMRYGLNQDIVNGADRERLLRGFTNSISTLSIVIDPEHLFNPKTGIYVNPKGDGRAWERFTMLEQINPKDDADGFTIPAGLRLRGGYSRKVDWAKHSFRFLFRSSYGKSELSFPIFPGEPGTAKSFDKLDLRTSQNTSWANESYTGETFVHEVFSRDTQRDLGQPYTRSRYYHLFLNGQYWGLYQTQERGDEHWGEDYLGGDSLEYDLIKTSSDYVNGGVKYSIEANEGTMEAWSNLWDIAVNEGFAGDSADNFTRVQGLFPDGTRNPYYPVLLNAENLMAYMLCAHYTLDADGPTSPFSDDKGHLNNLYALRNRNDSGNFDGFAFLRHDAEQSMGKTSRAPSANINCTFWGTEECATAKITREESAELYKRFNYFNPAELHYRLMQNPDYKRAFADYYSRNVLTAGGALSVEKSTERFQKRVDEIDDAIVCEAARWGVNKNFTATRDMWTNACAASFQFITNRVAYLTQHYQAAGWYPVIAAPQIVDANGDPLEDGDRIYPEDKVALVSTAGGIVYYTLDGYDPRREDGSVDASAREYAEPFALPEIGATITARVYLNGAWSALSQMFIDIDLPSEQQLGIRVAAIMSNTPDGGGDGKEFIVLTNILGRAVSLEGLRITCAKQGEAPRVDFAIGEGVSLGVGGSVKLTKAEYWPGADAKITNGKVDVKVYDANGKDVQTLFVDASWWSNACKGTGEYFVALDFRGYVDGKDVSISDISQWTHVKLPARGMHFMVY